MFNPMQMMKNNPIMQMMGMLQNSKNPLSVMQQLAGQNPQLQQITQGKTPQQMQQMAENLAKEKGVNLKEFMKQMGINRP